MAKLTRRNFLQASAAASAAFPLFTIAGTKASGRVLGANDTIRLGVAGIRGRGQSHIDGFAGAKNVQVTYLIDPDTRLFDSRGAKVTSLGGNQAKTVKDIRHALDDKELDAVSVATCNHWHSLITIWACQAGKDVYVEKPVSHNVSEGRRAVEVARKEKRIVQHGTQNRGMDSWARLAALVGLVGGLVVFQAVGADAADASDDVEPPPFLTARPWSTRSMVTCSASTPNARRPWSNWIDSARRSPTIAHSRPPSPQLAWAWAVSNKRSPSIDSCCTRVPRTPNCNCRLVTA